MNPNTDALMVASLILSSITSSCSGVNSSGAGVRNTVCTGPGTFTVLTGPGTSTCLTGPGTNTVLTGPGTNTVRTGPGTLRSRTTTMTCGEGVITTVGTGDGTGGAVGTEGRLVGVGGVNVGTGITGGCWVGLGLGFGVGVGLALGKTCGSVGTGTGRPCAVAGDTSIAGSEAAISNPAAASRRLLTHLVYTRPPLESRHVHNHALDGYKETGSFRGCRFCLR